MLSQQNESALHTLDTQPTGSQPDVSAPANAVHKSWAQLPCGGAPLACVVQLLFRHVVPPVQT